MRSISTLLVLGFILSSFSTRMTEPFAPDLAEGKLMVIVNTSVGVSDITMKNLKASFRGEKVRWENKKKIRLALMKTNTDAGKLTANEVLGMSGSELDRYYLTLVFQGKISAPKFFSSSAALDDYVNSTEGAIGIVSKSSNAKAKVINVNG
jgi:hypothetical protein